LHFPLFVCINTKPTQEMLENLLEPFKGDAERGAKFCHWALGGGYSGTPYDLADTITGGPDVSDGELEVLGELARCWDVDLRRPVSKPGAGVDVARFDIIKTLNIAPDAILINGEWHRNGYEDFANLKYLKNYPHCREQVEALLQNPRIQQQVEGEEVMLSRWERRWRDILDRQIPTSWLAVIDCHW
jgi:hypothetical protein